MRKKLNGKGDKYMRAHTQFGQPETNYSCKDNWQSNHW